MAKPIHTIIPDPELLISLWPEDVGAVILEHLNSLTNAEREQLNRYNFTLPAAGTFAGYPPQFRVFGRDGRLCRWCGRPRATGAACC